MRVRCIMLACCLLLVVAAVAHDPTDDPAWRFLGAAGASPKVRAVASDGVTAFILSDAGLTQLAADGAVKVVLPPEKTAATQSVAVSAQGIWLGGTDGVSRLDRVSGDITAWKPTPAPGAFDWVLFDAQGGIYIYEKATGLFSAYGADGALRWKARAIYDLPETLAIPEAVARRKNGDIYVADAENNRVLRFSSEGEFKGRVPDNFCRPHGLAMLPDGRLAVLQDYTECLDAPLITLLNAQDQPVADWVSNARLLTPRRPVFFRYALSYYQKVSEHPARPQESLSPLACCVAQGNSLLVGQAVTGSVKAIDLTAFNAGAKYPARVRQLKQQAITTNKATYVIPVGGTLDWTNTTRNDTHSGYMKTPTFMVDDAFTITNDGQTPVVNPHFSLNGKGDYFDEAHILRQIVPPDAKYTDLEKAFAVYNFVRSNLNGTNWVGSSTGMMSQYYVFNWWGIKEQGIKLTNKWDNFGAPGACGCTNPYIAKFAHDLGLQTHSGGVVGHVVSFEKIDGKEIYLDGIMTHSYRDPVVGLFCPLYDDKGFAGYDDVTRDQWLIMRVTEFPCDFGVVGCFGSKERHNIDPYDKPPTYLAATDNSNMGITLRPGESITRRTVYLGRSAIEPAMQMDALVNGETVYKPNFADGSYKFGVAEEHNVQVANGALLATTPDAAITFQLACPHPLLSGMVQVNYRRAGSADKLEMDINIEGRGWERIWSARKVGQATEMAYLWPLDQIRDTDEKESMVPAFSYQLRFRLAPAKPGDSPALTGLTITSLFQTFYQTIPRLTVGNNVVQYEDETPGAHQVTITHQWKESSFAALPAPPPAPISPADGAVTTGYQFPFKWEPGTDPNGEGIVDYEFEVSKRQDYLWPVAPNFNSYTRGKAEEPMPEYSLLTDNTTYYWHVRCQNKRGAWGPWSKTWTFRCKGPHVPVNVALRREGRTLVLSWAPNPQGTRPVKYEIFADNAQGFVPIVKTRPFYKPDSRDQYDKPTNIILTTDKTETVVVADGLKDGDRCYFRVAAIDADGSRSSPSDFLVAPHPLILTNPVTDARAGQEYRYQVKSLINLGEMTLSSPVYTFAHKDTLTFALKAAPAWLKVDPASGLLSGTPPAAGQADVTVDVSDGHGGADSQTFTIRVQ